MNRLISSVSLVLIAVAAFLATVFAFAFATAAASSVSAQADPDLWQLVRPVLDALRGGYYWLAGSFGLVALATGARAYGVRWVPWFASSTGSALLAFAVALGASAATQLAGGEPMSLHLLKTSAELAVGASGIYSLGRAVLVPILQPLAARWGGWRGAAVTAFLWALSKPDGRLQDAEKAGDDAVKADPGEGIAGVIGKPKELK